MKAAMLCLIHNQKRSNSAMHPTRMERASHVCCVCSRVIAALWFRFAFQQRGKPPVRR
jgi:hypothetical protein